MNGKAASATAVPLAEAGLPSSVAIVLDNALSVGNATVQLSKEDLTTLASGEAGAIREVGLVTTGGGARVAAQPARTLRRSRRRSTASFPATSALWDGLVMAATMLEKTGNSQRNVVLMVASADAGSTATYSQMITALRGATITSVHVVAMAGSTADGPALRELVDRLGGVVPGRDRPGLQALRQRRPAWSTASTGSRSTTSPFDGELASLSLRIGDDTVKASYRPNVLSIGADAVRPAPSSPTSRSACSAATW